MASEEYGLQFPDDARASWEEWLDDFETKVYPIFRNRDYDKNTALLAFLTNTLTNVVSPDDDGPS